jgi:3-isopropylmalate/(R)-2-methylmalate dehydratase small subunit
MLIKPIKEIKGDLIKLIVDNIDTDRIIPARFMKTVTFENLGEYFFYDERFDKNGSMKNHPLNNVVKGKDYILLSGKNFGCGSSREHAPQSLKRAGVKAVIAESFAEIFYGNATTIGLPCVVLEASRIESINSSTSNDSNVECTIDLINKLIYINNDNYSFDIDDGTRLAFINGTYDNLNILLQHIEIIKQFEKKLSYKVF